MKTKVAEKWAAALRSGEYAQATSRLRSEDGFCCLGVLCDLYHKETGKGGWVRPLPRSSWSFQTSDGYFHSSGLSDCVRLWAGMKSETGEIKDLVVEGNTRQKNHDTLANMNDRRIPFAHIANVIEQNVEKL